MIPSAGVRKAVPLALESKTQLSIYQTLAEGMFVWAEHSGVLPNEQQKRHSDKEKGCVSF